MSILTEKQLELVKEDVQFIKKWSHYAGIAPVIASYNTSCDVLCPICSKIHTHGNVEGSRVPHCENNLGKDKEYIVLDVAGILRGGK